MDAPHKLDADKRLARIAGQVEGLRKMVQEDRYCVDILTQIAAIRAALDKLGLLMLSSHLETCVIGHGTETEHDHCKQMTRDELLEEVQLVLTRFLK